MGLHIYNVDCMDFMKQCKNESFNLAIIDPPYGSAIDGLDWENLKRGRWGGRFDKYSRGGGVRHASGGGRFTKYSDGAKHWDIAPPESFFVELFRVSRFQIIWGGNYFPLPPSRNFIIWRKLSISENFSMAMVEQAWTNLQGNAKYFECAPQDKERFHPTQKPVELYAWLLSRYAKPGWKILDTHMGSGSIAIACHNLGFDLTACELDKTYFEKAMDRIKKHIAQQELFEAKEMFQPKTFFDDVEGTGKE
jgi:site-specific DNA-methyltransferase (adenine-specific)